MSETLYPYYERELHFIRQGAREFARQYPAAAGRLLLEPTRSVDPHVERLIESFALLAGRIHHKLDDEFPELTDALLSVLYPHYLAPVPSMGVVQFDLDAARGPLPDGFRIERHTRLNAPPVRDVACRYRTGYPVTLWPVALTSARLLPPPFPSGLAPPPRSAAVLLLQFEALAGMKFSGLSLDRLRLHLFGDGYLTGTLYELLFNRALEVVFRPLDPEVRAAPFALRPEECLRPVGFEADEGLLPYPPQSFLGYRLLTEFFAFPTKFLFADLGGFARARRAGFRRRLEVAVWLDRAAPDLVAAIDASAFRLGCAPVVNLFPQTAEPIPLTQGRYEYLVVPDVARPQGCEVYSVESVVSTDPVTNTTTDYAPFYSFRHGTDEGNQKTFWYAARRPSAGGEDRASEVYLSLVDLGFTPRLPADSTLVVRTTCTNRNLPAQLQRFGDQLALGLEAAAPLAAVRCLRAPTTPLRPPRRRAAYWRLVSHLNLNYLSLVDSGQGREALQEVLRLYDFADPDTEGHLAATNRHLIEGITAVSSRRVVGRTGTPAASGFCRGVEVTVELDEQKYAGTGPFLFACVLERFLALYASLNSFTQLIARTRQGEGGLKKWPPRAGEQLL
jgi:type VI secretion system protein ImpG